MIQSNSPRRGDIYVADLNPTRDREQAGTRPVLIVSADAFNAGGAQLVVVVPLTSRDKRIPYHVPIRLGEGGLKVRSYAKCEDVRSISKGRLESYWGRVSPATMELVSDRLRILMDL